MKYLNLTGRNTTQEQMDSGVIDPKEKMKLKIQKLLNFESIPEMEEVNSRAKQLAYIAHAIILTDERFKGVKSFNTLIDGVPFLMNTLEKELLAKGITPFCTILKDIK